MLNYGLVLLFATSVLAAPSTTLLTTVPISDYRPPQGNGNAINSRVLDLASSIVDGGDLSIYTTAAYTVVKDLADLGDPISQAMAAAQAIALIGEVIPGNPGDSCEAAALANAVASGNQGLIRNALPRFINRLLYNIDAIVQLNSGNENARYATGPRSGCPNNGRVYNLEAVWSLLLDQVSPYQIELVNELFCNARRLYNGLNVRSNNVGAALTGASTIPIINIFIQASPQVSRLLQVVAAGQDARAVGQDAKGALVYYASQY